MRGGESEFLMKSPLSIELSITQGCNHHCIHCYNPDRPHQKNVIIGDWQNNADRIINELITSEVKKVILTGGEPFLVKDRLLYFIRKFYEHNISFSVNTNATLVDKASLDEIKKIGCNPFFFISLPSTGSVACDEITMKKGSFEKILAGIELITDSGFDVGLNIVKNLETSIDLDFLSNLLHKNPHIVHVSISPVLPPVYNSSCNSFLLENADYIQINQELKKIHDMGVSVGCSTPMPICISGYSEFIRSYSSMCSAGRTHCAIDFESGNILACPQFEGSYGNIYTESLSQAWNRMNDWRACDRVSSECRICPSFSICGGDCRLVPTEYKKYKLHPISVESVFDSPPQLKENERYCVNKNLKKRKEHNGYSLLIDDKHYAFVKEPVVKLIELLEQIGSFSMVDLEKIAIIDAGFKKTFSQLLNSKIILIDNQQYKN